MKRVRLGSVGYLNARPLVYGLDDNPRFDVRYDVPAECARLLHARETDLGLIPSIEYLRGPARYALVPGLGVTSNGPVASVALYTRIEPRDVRSIAVDNGSRTSVALITILMQRVFGVAPTLTPHDPDLDRMLERADAALVIGDNALFLADGASGARKLDLGELWTAHTGLPFVYACWTGWPGALEDADLDALERARDDGVTCAAQIARRHAPDDRARQAVVERYLRDNIHYVLGDEEVEGLRTFYCYAAELGLASFDGRLQFYR